MSKPGIALARRMTAKERDLIRLAAALGLAAGALRAAKRRGCDPYNSAAAAGREWPTAFRLRRGAV